MQLFFEIEHGWMWFCVASGIALLIGLFLQRLSAKLATKVGAQRSFTILDLEFPSSPKDIPNTMSGIAALHSEQQQQQVFRALRQGLYLDFLFMPAAYGSIFLLCMLIAIKCEYQTFGRSLFAVLAWLQVLALVLDVVENLMLLPRARQGAAPMQPYVHKAYVSIVWVKWGIAMTGVVTASMMALYFWLNHQYRTESLPYLLLFLVEIVVFFTARYFLGRKKSTVSA